MTTVPELSGQFSGNPVFLTLKVVWAAGDIRPFGVHDVAARIKMGPSNDCDQSFTRYF